MTSDEIRHRLERDPDFVYLPRFGFSMEKLLARYPDGVPDKLIAQGLMITEDEVQRLYDAVVTRLRRTLKVRK